MSETSTVTSIKTALKVPSMWKVMLHDDDFTPIEFVVQILLQLFNKTSDEVLKITMHVHNNGSANIGLYTKEVARTKVEQVMGAAEQYTHPLLVTAEEA